MVTYYIHLDTLTQCSVEQTLLKTIVTDSLQENSFLDIPNTEVKIKN